MKDPHTTKTRCEGWLVRCTGCNSGQRNPMPDYCWRCGSPLEVVLDYEDLHPDGLFEGGVTDLWKYQALYPLASRQHRCDLNLGIP